MGETLHRLLQASTARAPTHAAFIRGDQLTTYEELDARSSRFAAGLRRLGVAKGDRIALVLDGEVEFLVAYYGIVKLGAVVVPLCSDTRTGSLVYALEHAETTAVILDAANVRYLGGQAAALPALRWVIHRGAAPSVDLGRLELVRFNELEAGPERVDDADVIPEALVSITYTSGTTGRPKGVMLAHRNVVANVRSIVEYLELRSTDKIAMVLPFYYVYGNSVLHTHLCAGATIVHAGSMTFPAEVLKRIGIHQCTGLSGVPATFARLLDVRALPDYELGSLRYITQAGAAMAPPLTARLRASFPSAEIFVMYGQTEAGARLAYVPPRELDRKLGSAGKAIPGVTLKIVGPTGEVLPPGVVGEVVAQGENVMVGYWKDPEETSKTLKADGLHTGDLAHMDEDGFLFIAGRQSEMIKSGAHRIGPREIESVIERLDGVRECAVVGIPDALLGQAIAAFIVLRDGAQLEAKAVQRACLNELPRFKVPEHVFMLAELPRTPNGKIQRSALVDWYAENAGKTPQPAA